MKNYRPEKDKNIMVFYVMLEELTSSKPKASFAPVTKGGLSLVVSRQAS